MVVAGDDPDCNELLCRILDARGHRARAVGSVASMNDVIADLHREPPAVMVIDQTDAGIQVSIDLLERLRADADPLVVRTRVIVVIRSITNRTACLDNGADGYLIRPFHADELLAAVDEVLDVADDDLEDRRRRLLDAGDRGGP